MGINSLFSDKKTDPAPFTGSGKRLDETEELEEVVVVEHKEEQPIHGPLTKYEQLLKDAADAEPTDLNAVIAWIQHQDDVASRRQNEEQLELTKKANKRAKKQGRINNCFNCCVLLVILLMTIIPLLIFFLMTKQAPVPNVPAYNPPIYSCEI